ncbi:MAG TPA: MFS transporter [Lapillicoccus sp.]|nr:MFS transporter [Lapillicoccus sp.]
MTTSDHNDVHTTPQDRRPPPATFASLGDRNFRLFLGGLFVSGTGVWMQRIAQDWLVLTLTDSPTAVGLTTAFQFLPTLLLGLHAGVLADRLPKRRVLQATQGAMALLAAVLAALTLTGAVQAWHVYVLATALGAVAAVDNPVRQAFVTEIVGVAQVRSAISMVSSTFQMGALVGPLMGGLLVGLVGPGWAFLLNALSYLGPLTALAMIRLPVQHSSNAGQQTGTGLQDGLRYALSHPTVLWPTVMVGTFGFFTVSLPVTLAAFAKNEFGSGALGAGILNGAAAAGALCGALVSARRRNPLRLRTIAAAAGLLAAAQVIASFGTSQAALTMLVVLVGAANLGFLTSAQSLVQLTVPEHLRGRVVAIYLLAFLGCGAIGGPVVGFVDETFGARYGLLLAGLVPALVVAAVARHLADQASVRLGFTRMTVQIARPALVARDR